MYKLTERAADDFAGIYDYTLLKFGEAQADHYTDALEAFFETLAGMPDMGRDYHTVPGVMRIEFQRHAIFYRGSRSNDVKNHAKRLIHCLY